MITRRALLTTVAATPLVLHAPPHAAAARARRLWYQGPPLNQYGLDACQGFALVNTWVSATRRQITTKQGNRLARYIYNEGMRQNAREFEVARDLGMLDSWTYLQTVDDLIAAVRYKGPVYASFRIDRSFENPRRDFIKPHPIRRNWNGHAVAVTGYTSDFRGHGPAVRLRNSWGRYWGDQGSAWMTVRHLRASMGARPHIGYYEDIVLASWVQ